MVRAFMARELHEFINTVGTKLTLMCDVEVSEGHRLYKTIFLPCGRLAKPRFIKGATNIFFVYQKDKWFLIH